MAIYQLIACTIIANDILKASVYFGTEVFRTEILRCVTQFVKQKKMLSHSQVWRSDALH